MPRQFAGENRHFQKLLHTVYNSQDMESTKCPSTEEWIKKMWYTYTMEYYSAIKKNDRMPLATTWMDPEIVILNEVSQTEKKKYPMTSLI